MFVKKVVLILYVVCFNFINFAHAGHKPDSNGNSPDNSTVLFIHSAHLDFYYKDLREYYAAFPDYFQYSPGELDVYNQVDGIGHVLPRFSPVWAAIHENGHTCNDQIAALDPTAIPRKAVMVKGNFRNCATLPAGQTTGKTVPCTWITSPVCMTVED
jgi:hypothetical protein